MTSRDIRDRFQDALEIYDMDRSQGKTLLQMLVTQLRDERNTLKEQLERANAKASFVEQEASKNRSSLQDARIELASLSQQLQNAKSAWQQVNTEVGNLKDMLNETPCIDGADIRCDILDMVAKSTATQIDELNSDFKKSLVEQCIVMKNLSLAEWASRLNSSRPISAQHIRPRASRTVAE